MKRKLKWYQIILLIFGIIIAIPFYLFIGLITGIKFLFTFPVEYPKYKKSKYRLVYKKKYKMGILDNWEFKFFEKLLEKGITLYRSISSYGYSCFYNEEYCFAHLDVFKIEFSEGEKVIIKESEKAPYITVEELITKERSYYNEAIDKKFILTISVVDSNGKERKVDSSIINTLKKKDVFVVTEVNDIFEVIISIVKN